MLKFNKKFSKTERVVLFGSAAVLLGSAIVLRRQVDKFIVSIGDAGVQTWIEDINGRGLDVVVLPREITQQFVKAGMLAEVPKAA